MCVKAVLGTTARSQGPNWPYLAIPHWLQQACRTCRHPLWGLSTPSLVGMDSLEEQNVLVGAWSFVDSTPTKAYISMGWCATECVLKDLNFIPKTLKCAVQDFSPFLWIQPDTGQHNHRLRKRPWHETTQPSTEQTLQHMTSLELVSDSYWSLFPFHYALLSPEVFGFLPLPRQGCSSAAPCPCLSLPLCRGELEAL